LATKDIMTTSRVARQYLANTQENTDDNQTPQRCEPYVMNAKDEQRNISVAKREHAPEHEASGRLPVTKVVEAKIHQLLTARAGPRASRLLAINGANRFTRGRDIKAVSSILKDSPLLARREKGKNGATSSHPTTH